jgi:hypothetical protein
VHHGISKPPHGEPDHGSDPEISPHPVAEDAQNTHGEVRHGNFALEGIARRPADGSSGRIGEDRVTYEGKHTRDPNDYHEEPQHEDLRYPPFRSGLLVQIDVQSADNQAEDQEHQANHSLGSFLYRHVHLVRFCRHQLSFPHWGGTRQPRRLANAIIVASIG